MITLLQVQTIHNLLIQQFGGGNGIRDMAALEAALARPYATFLEDNLYPEPIDKAAALLESILINHPFVDGNKRTGYVLARLILLDGNQDIHASQEEKYAMVIAVSKGEFRYDGIKEWLIKHVR